MSNLDIIRAWKDEEYRNSLSAEQKAQLPENPAGMVDLTDEETQVVQGGWNWNAVNYAVRQTLGRGCGRYFTITTECVCRRSWWQLN
ncbi:MAG: mersacidin/lichenicidin family type 2 lantibiotic [Dolichospermum sp. DET73]|jgi:mersacidin/lichenicidin family type 2 lantibiotic|nr:mersacidin/lichenicidin family type 2 lantibiotic [Dolichospermum sp. DET73]